MQWEQSPGVAYIGHFGDMNPKCKGIKNAYIPNSLRPPLLCMCFHRGPFRVVAVSICNL